MFRKQFALTWALTLTLAFSVLWPSAAFAQQANTWSAVEGDHPLWYSFAVGRLEDDELSDVTVRVEGSPLQGATFEIFAAGEWNYWATPDEEDWFGMSAESDFNDALWVGALPPGGYFVRVSPAGATDILVSISGTTVHNIEYLDVFNDDPVTFVVEPTQPPVAATPSLTPQPAMMTAATAPRLAVSETSESTASAATVMQETATVLTPGVWTPNLGNEASWVTFYVGHVEGEQTSHVTISLSAYPVDGGTFQVFDGLHSGFWGEPAEGDWLGAASVNDDGSISWAGDLVPGAYFVRVEPHGVQSCLLAISGQAVTY